MSIKMGEYRQNLAALFLLELKIKNSDRILTTIKYVNKNGIIYIEKN